MEKSTPARWQARMTGAILIISGRVPSTIDIMREIVKIFLLHNFFFPRIIPAPRARAPKTGTKPRGVSVAAGIGEVSGTTEAGCSKTEI